jgi:nitrite reductase (NO-forming)
MLWLKRLLNVAFAASLLALAFAILSPSLTPSSIAPTPTLNSAFSVMVDVSGREQRTVIPRRNDNGVAFSVMATRDPNDPITPMPTMDMSRPWGSYFIPGNQEPLPVVPTILPTNTPVIARDVRPERLAVAESGVTRRYRLRTVTGGVPFSAFVGEGEGLEGQVNPVLLADMGDWVEVTIVNADGLPHDFRIDELGVASGLFDDRGEELVVRFLIDRPGDFYYYSSFLTNRRSGMEGIVRVVGDLVIGNPAELRDSRLLAQQPAFGGAPIAQQAPVLPADPDAIDIVRRPDDLPPPLQRRAPQTVNITLETVEVVGKLADGTTFEYFTFDSTVPGPMIRVRLGDTVVMTLRNASDSLFPHSIALGATVGGGGGAFVTQILPGEEASFSFKATAPGLFVYHCATPSIAHHIANGMYGLILVEPEGGLPPVDREYYVMQGEIYTAQEYGTQGHLDFSLQALRREQPEYFVFNGSANALTREGLALTANVGETVRIFYGVGGPNYASALHLAGEIFDRVYDLGAITSAPLVNVSTINVPPGGAALLEFVPDVPGRINLVDHAYSRYEKGLIGFILVDGQDDPSIFQGDGNVSESSNH